MFAAAVWDAQPDPAGNGTRSSDGNWQLDPDHTQVEFSPSNLGMMTVRVISPGRRDRRHRPGSPGVGVGAGHHLRWPASGRTTKARDNDLRSSNFLEADSSR